LTTTEAALVELRELAELGRTTRLEAWCQRWSAPECWPDFAADVLKLTHAFAHERIIALVDACLVEYAAAPDPVTGPSGGTPIQPGTQTDISGDSAP